MQVMLHAPRVSHLYMRYLASNVTSCYNSSEFQSHPSQRLWIHVQAFSRHKICHNSLVVCRITLRFATRIKYICHRLTTRHRLPRKVSVFMSGAVIYFAGKQTRFIRAEKPYIGLNFARYRCNYVLLVRKTWLQGKGHARSIKEKNGDKIRLVLWILPACSSNRHSV